MSRIQWVCQTHRWVLMAFTIVSAAIFIALGLGRSLVQWVYYLPLLPLAMLVITGIYMFVLPYLARSRSDRPDRGWNVGQL